MAKIGVVASYAEFEKFARDIANEMNEDIVVKVGNLEQGIQSALELMETNEVEVIIARGYTGDMIKKNIDIPVIVIENTNFDLIRALYQARQYGEKIVIIGFERDKVTYNLDLVKKILNMEINYLPFGNLSETEDVVQKAYEKGMKIIVGTGSCVVREAEKRGMKGILIEFSPDDFKEAIKNARTTIEIRRKEIEKANWLKTVFDNSYEGTMTVSEDGQITVFNKVIGELLGVDDKRIIGNNIANLLKTMAQIKGIYGDGQEVIGDVLEINGNKLAVNRFPIYIGKNYMGILINVQRITHIQELEGKIRKNLYSKGFVAKSTFARIVGNSQIMKELKEKAIKYGKSYSNIMIYGESGTGKELFAQSIHNISRCSKGPFLAINCASLPENLLESELFGYEEGAFTGARKGGKPGLFELAHGGTIFLDEIGEIGILLQSRLLRVIQEKEVIRLGGDRIIPVNVRIICATNRDLLKSVREGTFREDLYYRINILKLLIPPLRDRLEDIPLIAAEIIKRYKNKTGKEIDLEHKWLERLKIYNWPGNVRELEAFLERLLVLIEGETITEEIFMRLFEETCGKTLNRNDISNGEQYLGKEDTINIKLGNIKDMEKLIIKEALEHLNYDRQQLAEILGISRITLWRKHKKSAP